MLGSASPNHDTDPNPNYNLNPYPNANPDAKLTLTQHLTDPNSSPDTNTNQGWGRLQKPVYDYDYSAHKIIDYDYSGD